MILCFGLFLHVWWWDSRRTLVFTPFLLFAANEILRNWWAAYAAPHYGYSSDHYALLVVLLSFAAFLAGYAFYSGAARNKPRLPITFRDRPVVSFGGRAYVYVVGPVVVVLTLLGIYLYQGIPPVTESVYAFLSGADTQEAVLGVRDGRRSIASDHYFGGEYRGQGLIRVVLRVGWSLCAGLALVLYFAERSRFWLLTTLGLVAGAFVFVAGDGTRSPFMWVLIFLLVLTSLVRVIHLRTVFVGVLVLILLLVGMSAASYKMHHLVGQGNFWRMATTGIVERILIPNGANTVRTIELVRSGQWDHRFGETQLRAFRNSLPGVGGTPFASELYMTLNPGATTRVFASPTYLAEVYLDFGLPGALITYFVIGVLLAFAQRHILRMSKTPLRVCLAGFVFLMLGRMTVTGFSAVISSGVILLAVYLCMRVLYSLVRFTSARRLPYDLPDGPRGREAAAS
jgi:oligosaccharide repeat unit polymerase